MGFSATQGWGAEFDRIGAGGLASSTESRLEELLGWGGFSSLMTPSALAVAGDAGVEPVGQVVGLSAGVVMPGHRRAGERKGPANAWTALRRRALERLSRQAALLGADAVVGVEAEREYDDAERGAEEVPTGQMQFSGTAVRVRGWSSRAPVLTLASAQELWSMLRAGVEPAGIAGGFASVQTPLTRAVGRPNMELEELTASVYEVRRLAMERLTADARSLKADGVLGVELDVEHEQRAYTVHVLASAVRRTRSAPTGPEPVLALADGGRG